MTGADAANADRRVVGRGTRAEDWWTCEGWTGMRQCSVQDLLPPGRRLVVVAPHPDDEVLGSGGLIFEAARHDREILVVAVTDGGGSHPGSSRWPSALLIEQRARERRAALAQLGVAVGSTARLGFTDGAVAAASAELSLCLNAYLRSDDVVISPWIYDGHPDHEATAAAVRTSCGDLGCAYLQVPIWGWHWTRPAEGYLPLDRAVGVALSQAALAAKTAAIGLFTSQLSADPTTRSGPILPEWVLERFRQPREVFLI